MKATPWFAVPPLSATDDWNRLVNGIRARLLRRGGGTGPATLATMQIQLVERTAALFSRGRGVRLDKLAGWVESIVVQFARFEVSPKCPSPVVYASELLRQADSLMPMFMMHSERVHDQAPVLMRFSSRAAAFRLCVAKLMEWMSNVAHSRFQQRAQPLHIAVLAAISYFLVLRARRRSLLTGPMRRWRIRGA